MENTKIINSGVCSIFTWFLWAREVKGCVTIFVSGGPSDEEIYEAVRRLSGATFPLAIARMT